MTMQSDLGKQSVNAVKWSAVGTIAQYLLQLAAQVVLARLLGPESYGLFAMGLLVLTLSNFLADFGFAWNLVQSQQLRDDDIRFVFTWQLISGGFAGFLLLTGASVIAGFFGEPRVGDIVRWLSLACVMNAAAAPAINLLRRRLDFRAISVIQLASYGTGYLLVGIPLAWSGAGVWALVTAWLVQSGCNLVLLLVRHPHPMKPLLWYRGASGMSGMGVTVFFTNLGNWLLNNLDRVLIGNFLNAQSVGLYTVGYNLANTPNNLLIGALQPAFLTAGARMQAEPERLRRSYLSIVATVWTLASPLFVCIAIIAPALIGVLYGPAWQDSALLLSILALAMPAYVTWAMSTPILWNTGRKHWESLLQLPVLGLAVYAYWHFARQGVVIVAGLAAAVLLLRCAVIMAAACRRLGIRWCDLAGSGKRGALICAVMALATWSGIEIGRRAGGSDFAALVGGTCIGPGTLLIILLLFPGFFGEAAHDMLGRFCPAVFARSRREIIPEGDGWKS